METVETVNFTLVVLLFSFINWTVLQLIYYFLFCWSLTLSRSTSVINIPNSEHIHASDKYILSFISVRSFANKKGLI